MLAGYLLSKVVIDTLGYLHIFGINIFSSASYVAYLFPWESVTAFISYNTSFQQQSHKNLK